MSDISRTANLVGALALAVTDRMDAVTADAAGLGSTVPAALVTLHQSPGIRIGELARVLALTHPGAVRLVDRMAAEGLLSRRAADDGRAVSLALEPKGRRAAQRVLARRAEVLEAAIASLDRSDRAHLERLLDRVLAALTPDPDVADHTCRLCDERVCTLDSCPVELAIAGQR